MFNTSITSESITNGHIVGTPRVATVTIIDNDSKYFLNHSCAHIRIYIHSLSAILSYVALIHTTENALYV